MHRYPPGKVNPVLIAFFIPLMVILAAAVFMVLRSHLHHALEPFDEAAYSHSSAELRGNEYGLDATIDSQLQWNQGFGRLLAVKPVNGGNRLTVFVPESVASDVRASQRFHMKVIVKDTGLEVEDMEKY